MVKIDLVKRRKIWYLISFFLLAPGIVSLFIQGLNLGIDFTGGTIMELKFNKNVRVEEVRGVLADFGWDKGAQVQKAGNDTVLMKLKSISESDRNKFKAALEKQIGNVEIVKEDNVGPTVGRELAMKALLALAIASVFMIIYITFRFELKSGLAAIIALLHDVILVIGVYSIFQIEVDSAFIAAILTIVGYAINNTIVVFDRIRENNSNKKNKLTDEEIVNKSIWQSLTRSINTTLAVLFVLVSLYLFGGATIKNFVLALIIGVSIGLYTSLLIASPLWIDLLKKDWAAKPQKA